MSQSGSAGSSDMGADVVIIGGGVIGVAVAARLAATGMEAVLLEHHPVFGRETSSRNSEVIHAGMYYPAGTLKARLCVAGNRSLRSWCETRAVPHRMTGKFIVATSPEETEYLDALVERGHANGVGRLRLAAPGELASEEPHVRAHAALWSPDTGIVDSHQLMASLVAAAETAGAGFAWGHTWLGADPVSGGYQVRFKGPDGGEEAIMASRVVNAAGLLADEVAAAVGIDIDAADYRLRYVKGSYFRISEGKRGLVRHLVYPVPDRALGGLGIHVTLDLAGGMRLGPDVEFLAGRALNYEVNAGAASRFAAAAIRYLPSLVADDLQPDMAGIRPRRIVPGGGVPDFVVAEESARGLPGWVNLIGIESPGLTCCLEIAGLVAELLDA